MRKLLPVLIGAAVLLPGPRVLAQDPLSRAKDLYGSAEYEQALAVLNEARGAQGLERMSLLAIEQYRALCLLAISNKPEAERAIEAVLDLDPFYVPGEDDAAPWVRTAFREVRRRVLPGTLQQLYARGKQAFDGKEYGRAEDAFRQVLRILDDGDLSIDDGARADMRMVVDGFVDLARAAASGPPPVPVPQLPPAPASSAPASGGVAPAAAGEESGQSATPPGAAPAGGNDAVYDSSASDVVPPLPLRQSVSVPEAARPMEGKEGLVEIVIGRNGAIESARIRQSFGNALDAIVLQSVESWSYRPAARAGSPVRYRRLVRIVLPGR